MSYQKARNRQIDLIEDLDPSESPGLAQEFSYSKVNPFRVDGDLNFGTRKFGFRIMGGASDFDDNTAGPGRRRFADQMFWISYPYMEDEDALSVIMATDYALIVEVLADESNHDEVNTGFIDISAGEREVLPYEILWDTLPGNVFMVIDIPLLYEGV